MVFLGANHILWSQLNKKSQLSGLITNFNSQKKWILYIKKSKSNMDKDVFLRIGQNEYKKITMEQLELLKKNFGDNLTVSIMWH